MPDTTARNGAHAPPRLCKVQPMSSHGHNEEDLWHAVQMRDSSQRDRFFYGVTTTRIFCRPDCPARLPRRDHVRFYKTAEAAQADGLRACLRCKPLDDNKDAAGRRMAGARAFIRQHLHDRESLKLANLSARFGLSPFHFQRCFKRAIGVTPRRYAETFRTETFKAELRSGDSVTAAIYSAGFHSSSRVYEDSRLAMTPGQYRAGGLRVEITYATAATPLGLVMLGATDRGLCFVEFGKNADELVNLLREEFPAAHLQPMQEPASAAFHQWMDLLSQALRGELRTHVAVALHGTAFQIRVWQYLQSIPRGTTQTYTEVAAAIGKPRAVRAVANVCAANRVAVLVPCHRVIRGDGGLGGYRWGLERKRALLRAEAAGGMGAELPPSPAVHKDIGP